MGDESGESMEQMEEVPLAELGESRIGVISAWLTERSRELITADDGKHTYEYYYYYYKTCAKYK